MKNLKLEVQGMNCGSCVKKIVGHFEGNEQIEKVSVDLESKKVEFMAEDNISNMFLRNEITDLGFTVTSMQKG